MSRPSVGDLIPLFEGATVEAAAKMTPGPDEPIAGDFEWGYFGPISPTDMGVIANSGTTADGLVPDAKNLAIAVGMTEGEPANENLHWFKFSFNKEVLFVANDVIRHTFSLNELAAHGLIHGGRVLNIGGMNYRTTLLKGLSNDCETVSGSEYAGGPLSEWDMLLRSLSANPYRPGWGIELSDDELGFAGSGGLPNRPGMWNLTKEYAYADDGTVYYTGRYGKGGSKTMAGKAPKRVNKYNGWRPVLRFTFGRKGR